MVVLTSLIAVSGHVGVVKNSGKGAGGMRSGVVVTRNGGVVTKSGGVVMKGLVTVEQRSSVVGAACPRAC